METQVSLEAQIAKLEERAQDAEDRERYVEASKIRAQIRDLERKMH